jgi:hypothetical protein
MHGTRGMSHRATVSCFDDPFEEMRGGALLKCGPRAVTAVRRRGRHGRALRGGLRAQTDKKPDAMRRGRRALSIKRRAGVHNSQVKGSCGRFTLERGSDH